MFINSKYSTSIIIIQITNANDSNNLQKNKYLIDPGPHQLLFFLEISFTVSGTSANMNYNAIKKQKNVKIL